MRFQDIAATCILYTALGSFSITTAADSAGNSSGASTHASKAVTLGIAASGQATLGVMAVPLLSGGAVSGSVGAASTTAGKHSSAAAGVLVDGALPITDETITIMSPAEALKQRAATLPR